MVFLRYYRILIQKICISTLLLIAAFLPVNVNAAEDIPWQHAISMIGTPALEADYDHFAYANPNAPKGGKVVFGVFGTFNSLNSYALKGAWTSARGMRERPMGNNILESLLIRNNNEPFTLYTHLAEAVRMPEERNWIEFRLNPKAHFSNGKQLTVEDVVFSFKTLRDHARPPYSSWYKKVTNFEKTGPNSLKLHFKDGSDRELPLLVSLAPIFNSETTDPNSFENTTLTPLVGTGPYQFKAIEPGRRTVYERTKDYWAKDLPQKRGFDNFDEIIVEYYRDYNTMLEALKKGAIDTMVFTSPALWTETMTFPATKAGDLQNLAFTRKTPPNLVGLAFNTRKEVFSDVRVRRALSMLFDFKTINRTLFSNLYVRTNGYWDHSELSSISHPASPKERELLSPYPALVPEDVMNGTWHAAEPDGHGIDRKTLKLALNMLGKAGYKLNSGRLLNSRTGKQMQFEVMIKNNDEEKVALVLQRTMKLIGISMSIRMVDAAQFEERRTNFDFDATFNIWFASLSPGGEQYARWSSKAADIKGSRNIVGAKEPAIDALLDKLVASRSKQDFVATVRALDRVLISGAYAIPLYHPPAEWWATWKKLSHPKTTPLYGVQFDTWWQTVKNN
ncbi:extracellular solute-binding protein [Polycladidibacter stylochi]|uniref:extracellular solute-binding protein n=1 Tax=Polycladidibacter stylochi TaxID=1807766 RepID=UPI0008299254|nr:extracellular solute-binding protein [Pseudovibrio stylochi]